MAKGKTNEQLEQTAKNLCQNMGIDFDEAWQQFQNTTGGFGNGVPFNNG